MVPADSHRISRVPRYSGSLWAASPFAYKAVTSYGRFFQSSSARFGGPMMRSYNPGLPARVARFGLFRVRSPLLAESWLFSFPPGTEMVHFPGFAPAAYGFSRRRREFAPARFPHSDIPGSQLAYSSPRLFAVSHVLHRLLSPRHPPYALSSLTEKLARNQRPPRSRGSAAIPSDATRTQHARAKRLHAASGDCL